MLQHEQLLWPKLFLHCNYRKATLRWQLTTSNNFLRLCSKSPNKTTKFWEIETWLCEVSRLVSSQSLEVWLSRNKVIWKTSNYRVNMHFHKEEEEGEKRNFVTTHSRERERESKRWWIAMIVRVSSSFLLRENLHCCKNIIIFFQGRTFDDNCLKMVNTMLRWEWRCGAFSYQNATIKQWKSDNSL